MSLCLNCPRHCAVDRSAGSLGFCQTPDVFRVSRIAKHLWEEPCISGEQGSGTVFFCGCNLRCVFCQNREISRGGEGKEISDERLAEKILALQEEGVANVNLVTPTHYASRLVPFLESLRPKLHIPVVYNCGGYEDVETLRRLAGLIDIYLPDCKYFDDTLAKKYSSAPHYFANFLPVLKEMLRQVGSPRFFDNGMLKSGVIVRHLVLPGNRKDSVRILEELQKNFGTSQFLLSLMNQYTPDFALDSPYPELHRRLTTFEYQSVLATANDLGFDGYSQEKSSATKDFTPKF